MDNFSNTKIANVSSTAWITSIIQSYKTSVIYDNTNKKRSKMQRYIGSNTGRGAR